MSADPQVDDRTSGAQVTLVIPASVGRVFVPGTRNRATEYVLPGGTVLLLPDGSEAAILPGDARPALAAGMEDAIALWSPIRCRECAEADQPCAEDCAGDPDKARLYGLLADALEGRPAEPLWELADRASRVSVRVVMTGPGREPLVSGKENAGPAEAAGFLRGWADEIERVASQGGSGE